MSIQRYAIDVSMDDATPPNRVEVILFGSLAVHNFVETAKDMGLDPGVPTEISERAACLLRMRRTPEQEEFVQGIIDQIFPDMLAALAVTRPQAPF